MEQLAIHEFRHVVQMSKIHQGFGKALYFVLGEQSVGALTGLFIPQWFLEGDAVCTETALSHSGRGRSPAFTNKIKAQLLEKGKYSYDKTVYGSFKDFVPDHYELGYLITSQARKDYGKEIWSDVLNNVARKPYTIFPFSMGIKKASGLIKSKLYKAVMDTLQKNWMFTNTLINSTYFSPLSKKNAFYTNYETPFSVNDSLTIAFKKNMNEDDAIVSIDKNGHEKNILKTGFIIPSTVNYANNTISFIEYKNDVRWQNRSYSNIVTFNPITKKVNRLTHKARYQTSVLNADGSKIAAVYNTPENITGMHIIDAHSGEIITKINNENNFYIIDPSWSKDGVFITCVLQNETGKALGIIDINKNQITNVTDFTNFELNYPFYYKQHILYTSNYNGIDNIYALDTNSKRISQLTSSLYGASKGRADFSEKNLLYLNLASGGNEIVCTPFDSLLWQPINQIKSYQNTLYNDISLQENGIIDFYSQADSTYLIKPYRKYRNLFNIHSWAPLYLNVDQTTINPGLMLLSQNLLSTATSSLGYKYDPVEKAGKYVVGFEYSGFFPILSTNIEYGTRKYSISNSENKIISKETKIDNGISIPITISRGRYVRQFQLSASNDFIIIDPLEDSISNAKLHTLDYGLYFYNYIKSNKRDIYPRWAQSASLKYAHSPLSYDNVGRIAGANLNMFFPGLFKHHSFFVSSSYQQRDAGKYTFNYIYPLPKGFNDLKEDFKSILRISSNYALPLLYPDFSVSSLIYIKRLRTLLFYDYGITYNKNQMLRSYGFDLLADVHLLRFIAPIELGIRYIYRQNDKKMIFEPLFSVKFEGI